MQQPANYGQRSTSLFQFRRRLLWLFSLLPTLLNNGDQTVPFRRVALSFLLPRPLQLLVQGRVLFPQGGHFRPRLFKLRFQGGQLRPCLFKFGVFCGKGGFEGGIGGKTFTATDPRFLPSKPVQDINGEKLTRGCF